MLDFSDYSEDSKFFDAVNKKVIGKMKDEVKGKIISVFSVLIDIDNEENKKAKEVNKNVVKNIRPKEYVHVLFSKKIIRDKTKRIQSKLHKIETYSVCKISLSYFDVKRYILDDAINSLTDFHKNIRSQ